MRRNTKQERNARVVQLALGGKTLEEIGVQEGITRQRVQQILSRAGVRRRHRVVWTEEEISWLGKLSDHAIARKKKVSVATVFLKRRSLRISPGFHLQERSYNIKVKRIKRLYYEKTIEVMATGKEEARQQALSEANNLDWGSPVFEEDNQATISWIVEYKEHGVCKDAGSFATREP